MDNTYKITTHNDEETIEVAQNLESEKFPNMVICLNGDLGSGKTVFTKGFASAMAIEEITSPTFNIIKEYNGELPLYHMDVYRTNGKIDQLGLEEYFDNDSKKMYDFLMDHLDDEIKLRKHDEAGYMYYIFSVDNIEFMPQCNDGEFRKK